MNIRTRKIVPSFTPKKLVLKQEDGTERNPVGPLFYEGSSMAETSPVYLDLEMPTDLSKHGFSPVWFSLREVRNIAAELKLPLEVF